MSRLTFCPSLQIKNIIFLLSDHFTRRAPCIRCDCSKIVTQEPLSSNRICPYYANFNTFHYCWPKYMVMSPPHNLDAKVANCIP